MPYIQIRTNKEITKDKEIRIKERLGEAIAIVGKSESWLMVEFVSNASLYFKGSSESNIAYVDVKLYGGSSRENYSKFTSVLCESLNENLEIEPSNVYVSYGEYANWGWNGNNF